MSKWTIFAVEGDGDSSAPKVSEEEAETSQEALVNWLFGQSTQLPTKAVVVGQSPAMTHRTAQMYDIDAEGTPTPEPF